MAPKAKTSAVKAQPGKAAAAPTGLQLSSAQWKAYNAAYTASANAGYRRLAIQAAAQSLRQSRLNAAYSMRKKVAAAHASARTAAIAAFAAKMSFKQSQQAHQNAALQNRVYADYMRHVQAAGRLQFAYKGEKVYLHTAVMNTLTSAQAMTIETAAYAKAVKTAKAAVASVKNPAAAAKVTSAASAAVQASAKAAGLAAARATPVGRTAPRPGWDIPGAIQRGVWYGDPEGEDCVAAAIANSLQFTAGWFLAQELYDVFRWQLGSSPPIGRALRLAQEGRVFWNGKKRARLVDVHFWGNREMKDGCVIGFDTENGPHAALYVGRGMIASWGELLPLSAVLTGAGVDEVWEPLWQPLAPL